MELFPGTPPIVLDGAHNGDSAKKLRESLAEAFPGRPIVFVLGMSQGHSAEHVLSELLPYAQGVVLTRSIHPRAVSDLDKLAALAAPLLVRQGGSAPIALAPTLPEALARARELAGPASLICVTGSLFVVAAAREALGLDLVKD
jgi:dihydrofolate synthase/folylpolyglutamate synthase